MEQKALYQERLRKVVESLKKTDMDALLLNTRCNIGYLTGSYSTCSWLFITKKGELLALVLDSDVDSYQEESFIGDIRTFTEHPGFHMFKSAIDELGLSRSKIGLELGNPSLTKPTVDHLKDAVPSTVQFVNGELLVEEMRAVKTKEEIDAIEKAAEIAELGMDTAIKNIKPGIRERDVILEAEYAMRKAGGTIPVMNYIASGKRSRMAHPVPSPKKIEKGDLIVLDIHGGAQGYCADLSRTIVCGKGDNEKEQAYSCLIRAEEEAIDLCRRGQKLVDIKKTFYRKLAEAKSLKFLTGPVLHGVGVIYREMPYFGFPYHEKGYPEVMEANMVVAVSQIGLYSKQGWGVRVEDTVLVTENEPIYLTRFTKELLSI
jgi:Xaa-Pro dipeptidase